MSIAFHKEKQQWWEKLMCDLHLSMMKWFFVVLSYTEEVFVVLVQIWILPSLKWRGRSKVSHREIKSVCFPRRYFTDSFESWWWKHSPLITTFYSLRIPVLCGWRTWSQEQGHADCCYFLSPQTSIAKLLRPESDLKWRQFPVFSCVCRRGIVNGTISTVCAEPLPVASQSLERDH